MIFDRKNIITIIVEAILFIGIIFGINSCKNEQIDIANHNLETSLDSLRIYKLKNNELLYEKKSYILEKSELSNVIDINKKEINELEKKLKNKIAYISAIESMIGIKDTIYITNDTIIYNDEGFISPFAYTSEWINLNGKIIKDNNIINTSIDNIYIPVPLQVGLTDSYNIFIKSKNPLLTITDIEGSVIAGSNINPKQKRFGHGISLGVGVGYGLIHNKIDIVVYGGYGFYFRFGKK